MKMIHLIICFQKQTQKRERGEGKPEKGAAAMSHKQNITSSLSLCVLTKGLNV